MGWRRVKEEEEKEEEEGKVGTRKPDGGSDGDDGGGRRVAAEFTCRRRRRRGQGSRTTGWNGKDSGVRPPLILVLLGDKGGDASADEKAAQGLVVS